MTYLRYPITCDPELTEILLALLADAGFDSFQETDDGLEAYAEAAGAAKWLNVLTELGSTYAFSYSVEEVVEQNWNAVWEGQFHPIQIDDRLLLRASFHDSVEGVARELVIDPKMAFGTGHHATTYMMCERVLDHLAGREKTERVLDFGCGTGVLAILAAQLGAAVVDAVDIERPAYESTLENAAANGVVLSTVVHGQLADVALGQPYDLILANINRNVLLAEAGPLYERLRAGGTLYLSGILDTDEALVVRAFGEVGFIHLTTHRSADWCACAFTR